MTFSEEGGGETDDLLPKMEKSVVLPFFHLAGCSFLGRGGKTDRFLTNITIWAFGMEGDEGGRWDIESKTESACETPLNSARFGPVYTKHQRQGCNHSAMTLVILFSLKSVESTENGLQTHS